MIDTKNRFKKDKIHLCKGWKNFLAVNSFINEAN